MYGSNQFGGKISFLRMIQLDKKISKNIVGPNFLTQSLPGPDFFKLSSGKGSKKWASGILIGEKVVHSWNETFSCKWNMASGPWICIAALQTNTEFHFIIVCSWTLQFRKMLQDNFLDQPWECEGLDPFRDDPIATESGFEEKKSWDCTHNWKATTTAVWAGNEK